MEGGTPSNKVLKRSTAVGIFIALILGLLCFRILFIQIFDFEEYEQKVIDQITQTTPVGADRGKIYDANGVVLATNITTYRLFIVHPQLCDITNIFFIFICSSCKFVYYTKTPCAFAKTSMRHIKETALEIERLPHIGV